MTNHVRSVFLIRHGRTSYNAAHKLQGQVDIPLDAVLTEKYWMTA